MAEVTFSSDVEVKLIRHMGGDESVVQAAQASSKGENNPGTDVKRLINALMKGGHGSPFEHNAFTFFVKAPIFVFREWFRHRISSFNEMSGRYTELLPEFYVPAPDRGVVNKNTKMQPEFADGGAFRKNTVSSELRLHAERNWESYKYMLDADIAPEVARMVLPLNVYSQMYWTVNARSLMNFLSLRVDSPDSAVRSYPQWEIQLGAMKVETLFAEFMPYTHAAFVTNGRVAP